PQEWPRALLSRARASQRQSSVSSWLSLLQSPFVVLIHRSPRGAIPVRRQERRDRCEQLLRRLLGDPVPALGNDLAFHVLSNQPHSARGAFAETFASTDGEHGQRQLALLALCVLRARDVDRSIGCKAAAQGVAARCEALDVVLDHRLWQWCACRFR